MSTWSVVWEILKVLIFPLCIWYFQHQIQKSEARAEYELKKRDEKRERENLEQKRELEDQQEKNIQLQFLMMERIDASAETTHLMARKLHDAGIINGDLEELDNRYKELNKEYESNLRGLALQVLNER